MHRKPLAIALLGLAALTVVGCRREAPDETAATTVPPPAADVAAATEPAPAPTDATTVVENTAADAITGDSKDFDAKAFAGSFSGTLPCADCPGIDTTLTLNADGHFVLAEHYQQQADANNSIDGTWTAEQDGKQIRLDPASKSEDDRVYAIVSSDHIRQLDSEGKPAVSGLDYSLRREGSAQ